MNENKIYTIESLANSREIEALLRFCKQNGFPSISAIPTVGTTLSRFVGPNLSNVIYPSIEGDRHSMGGHGFRTWYSTLTLFQYSVGIFFPYNIVDISCYRQITAASLNHDIGKLSPFDEAVRSTEFFSDPFEKRRKVSHHVYIIPILFGGIMSAMSQRNNPNKDISTLMEPIDFEDLKLALYFGALLHHFPIEGYPDLQYLRSINAITEHELALINEQLDASLNKSPTEALQKIINGNKLERAIAIALTILPAADTGDALLSKERPYQREVFIKKDSQRLDQLYALYRRGFSKALSDVFITCMQEIYSNPLELHKRSMWHFANLLSQTRKKPKITPPRLTLRSRKEFIIGQKTNSIHDSVNSIEIGRSL